MRPPVDYQRSVEIMEAALAKAPTLGDQEKANIRSKALDLYERRVVWESTPLRVQIEANRRCQVKCVHCDIAHPWDSELDFAVIEKLYAEVGPGSLEVMPYTGGEPTLAPLERLAALGRRYNNFLSFTTNGILLDRDLFSAISDATSRVTISFHSHVRATFEAIEPGIDYDQIVENMRSAVEISEESGTELMAGIVIMEQNLDQLPDWFRFVADLGFQHAGLTRLYPNTEALDELDCYGRRPQQEIERIVDEAMHVAHELGVFVETNVPEAYYTRHPRNVLTRETPYLIHSQVNELCSLFQPGFCPLTANMITLEHDGTVIPCVRAHMPLGNLKTQSFEEIWNGERMIRLRQTFLERSIFRECSACQDFFCDKEHPTMPPMGDSGTWFNEQYGAVQS